MGSIWRCQPSEVFGGDVVDFVGFGGGRLGLRAVAWQLGAGAGGGAVEGGVFGGGWGGDLEDFGGFGGFGEAEAVADLGGFDAEADGDEFGARASDQPAMSSGSETG